MEQETVKANFVVGFMWGVSVIFLLLIALVAYFTKGDLQTKLKLIKWVLQT